MDMPRAQIIKKDGRKEFAVLPYDDYVRIQKDLEDYEDLRVLREAKEREKEAPTIGLSDLKKSLKRRSSKGGKTRR